MLIAGTSADARPLPGLLPEPKHYWYDINEYRLNSKPHIRRVLQHQQEQDRGASQALQGAAESGKGECDSRCSPSGSGQLMPALQHMQCGGGTSASGTAKHDQVAGRQHKQQDSWQQSGAPQQGSRPEGKGRTPTQAADAKRALPDSWQPVTASQLLKRQRAEKAGRSSTDPQQQWQPSSMPSSSKGGAHDVTSATQAEIDGACEHGEFGGLLGGGSGGDWNEARPCDSSEQSCEDVLATWGEAGEQNQEHACAEPPAGITDGDGGEGMHAGADMQQAAPDSGSLMWACQVCCKLCQALEHSV